jgi:hypothetical protein
MTALTAGMSWSGEGLFGTKAKKLEKTETWKAGEE